ncbi:MAG: hypothetical protein ACOYL3_26235 [Desulfuromonadaceae bacterium]
MPEIFYENTGDVVVLKVVGSVTFDQISDALNQYFPLVSKHLIWDYTEGDLDNVSPFDFKRVPEMSKQLFTNRQQSGRTAFICPTDYLFGMFRMYTAFADIEEMPYKYEVFKTMREAIVWVRYVDSVVPPKKIRVME